MWRFENKRILIRKQWRNRLRWSIIAPCLLLFIWFPVLLPSGAHRAFVNCFADGSFLLFLVLVYIEVEGELRRVSEKSVKWGARERLREKAEDCRLVFMGMVVVYVLVKFLFVARKVGWGEGFGWGLTVSGIVSAALFVPALWYAIRTMRFAYIKREEIEEHDRSAEERHIETGHKSSLPLREIAQYFDSERVFVLVPCKERRGWWVVPERCVYPEGGFRKGFCISKQNTVVGEALSNGYIVVDPNLGDKVPQVLQKAGIRSAIIVGVMDQEKEALLVVCNSKRLTGVKPFQVSYTRRNCEDAEVFARLVCKTA